MFTVSAKITLFYWGIKVFCETESDRLVLLQASSALKELFGTFSHYGVSWLKVAYICDSANVLFNSCSIF